jgi:hypothetical protein
MEILRVLHAWASLHYIQIVTFRTPLVVHGLHSFV